MAYNKNSGYIVESKTIRPEKKRRSSDLVVMWISLWDFIASLVLDIYVVSFAVWTAAKRHFGSDEKHELRKWLDRYLPWTPNDFAESWRDGILLSNLLNKLKPGCYPDAKKLDFNYGLRNLYRAFYILETEFNIIPKVTVEEVLTCSNDSDLKLISLLLQLRQKVEDKEIVPSTENEEAITGHSSDLNYCVARGTGLTVGFVGRPANFIIFCSSMSDMDLLVDIKGSNNTACSERITKRSPKRKTAVKPWKTTSSHYLHRSSSNPEEKSSAEDHVSSSESDSKCISLEYEILPNQINFTYTPLFKGEHKIQIMYHGQGIMDSPFTAIIEQCEKPFQNGGISSCDSKLNLSNFTADSKAKNPAARFQKPAERKENLGKILKRRVLRYVVKIDNKDIVVETDSLSNLATSLLKMDYEIQKVPLNRRNSWGFVGDAERKVSVIRQFCVNPEELEAQSVQLHRSNSLTFRGSKNTFERSSYECEDVTFQNKGEGVIVRGRSEDLQRKLETVTEEAATHFKEVSQQDEEALALLDEEFDCNLDGSTSNVDCDVLVGIHDQTDILTFNDQKNARNLCSTYSLLNQRSRRSGQIIPNADIPVVPIDEELNVNSNAYKETGEFDVNHAKLESAIDYFNAITNEYKGEELLKEISFAKNQTDTGYGEIRNENEIEKIPHNINAVSQNFEEDTLIAPDCLNPTNDFVEEEPFVKTDATLLYSRRTSKNRSILADAEDSLREELPETKNKMANNVFLEPQKMVNNDTSGYLNCATLKQPGPQNDYWEKSGITQIKNNLSNENQRARNMRYREMPFKNESKYHRRFTHSRNSSSDILTSSKINSNIKVTSSNGYRDINFKRTHQNNKKEKILNNNDLLNGSALTGRTSQSMKIAAFSTSNDETCTNGICVISDAIQRKDKSKPCQPDSVFHVQRDLELEKNLISKINNEEIGSKLSHVHDLQGEAYTETQTIELEEFVTDSDQQRLLNPQMLVASTTNMQSSQTKTPPFVTPAQFHYKHFSLPLSNKSCNRVRNQIKRWENVVEKVQHVSLNIDVERESEFEVKENSNDFTSKLQFWNKVHHKDEILTKPGKRKSEMTVHCGVAEEVKVPDSKMSDSAEKRNCTIIAPSGFFPSPFAAHDEIKEKMEIPLRKRADVKFPRAPQHRSYSDPGATGPPGRLECLLNESKVADELGSVISSQSSSYDISFSDEGSDDGLISGDVFNSTEDEYIDDEISENTSTYWGDLTLQKLMKVASNTEYEDFTMNPVLLKEQSFQPCLNDCKVFGIATYFGYVAVKNRFKVLILGADHGNLSATVQGSGLHDVSLVSVEYSQNDIYEVTYQVMTPGLYSISVRWMEVPIVGSPFLCKVTF